MTMPSKIRAWKTSDAIGSTHGWNETIGDTPYIRADIAEDLALALEQIKGIYQVTHCRAADALTAYREASK